MSRKLPAPIPFSRRLAAALGMSLVLIALCVIQPGPMQTEVLAASDYASQIHSQIHLYHEAAEQGSMDAQHMLGCFYDLGLGVPEDLEKAAYWYRKAAEQGHAEAQYNLGIMLYTGDGIPQDKKEGVQWLRKAAVQGYDEAQEYLDELPKTEGGR